MSEFVLVVDAMVSVSLGGCRWGGGETKSGGITG